MNSDPVEDFIDQLRPALERWRPQLAEGVITSLGITARQEKKQRRTGWAVKVSPESDEKVIEAWCVDMRGIGIAR